MGTARTKTESIVQRYLFSPKKRGPMRQLCPQQEHLLTLMRLRLGLTYHDLAKRFGVHTNIPDTFQRLRDRKAILDCKKIFIDTPKDHTLQNLTWSSYNHHNTTKLLIAVTPYNQMPFISEMYGGKTGVMKSPWIRVI